MSGTSVGGADVDMGDSSTIAGAGTPSSCTPVVAGACVSLIGGADVDMGESSTVAGAGKPSSCTPVVAGACVLSVCMSIGIGSTVCKSESKVGGCVVVASGQPAGMLGLSSRLSSISSLLQTM